MSVYPPPSFTEYIPIFNPINWEATIDEGITIAYLNSNFLKYPVAQGLETLNGMNNLGDTTLSKTATCIDSVVISPTDSSTKIPTTAWVQTAISATPSTNVFPQASYYISNLINTSGIPAPYPKINITGFSGFNYWDGIIFEISVNYTIYSTTTSSQSGSVFVNNSTSSCSMMTIYPKAFTNCSAQNVFYLNNAVGSTTANTAYAPISSSTSAYTPNGRPFYCNGTIVNESNIDVVFPITFSNDGTTASMIFNFPLIGWGGATTGSYAIMLKMVNRCNYPLANIHTSGFSVNF